MCIATHGKGGEDEERTLWKGAPPLRRDTVELELSAKVESNAHSTKYATTAKCRRVMAKKYII